MRNRKISLILFFTAVLCCAFSLQAQDRIDETSTKQIKEYTTRPEFLSPLVDYIPESKSVPSPRDFLGYVIGTPKKLTYARDIHRYYYELAKKSGRIKVIETGKSNEGRSRILAIIADEKTLKNINTYKSIMKKLADPRKVKKNEAEKAAKEAKPIYLLTGGLHSTETGSPDMLMELAYRLIVSDTPKIKSIRENMITLIIPVLEVDGREKMVDWYYRYTVNLTDYGDGFPHSPPYWGSYTFHDNNREGLQISQPLTKQMSDVFFEYLPVVSLDLHESVPFLYISMGTGPYNPNIDPITITEFQLFANYEVSELTKYGMPGVWTWGFYTGWYPGYLLWITANHNSIGRFYETYGNAGANTFERNVRGNFAKKPITSKQWYRQVPPPKRVKWSFRNNINFMQSGVISGLYFASQNGEMLLNNFYQKSLNAVSKGKNSAPYAWLITGNKKKKDMTGYLINQLIKHKIEVHESLEEITYGGKTYPKGTFVVRLDQPYGPYAKNLLEKQTFPNDADYTPYDDVAWTLGLQYGVETVRVDSNKIFSSSLKLIKSPVKIKTAFPENKNPEYFIVPDYGSPSLVTLRYELKDFEINAAEESFVLGGDTIPAGSWIIPGKNTAVVKKLKDSSEKLSIDVISSDIKPDAASHSLDLPRIGVYHNWIYTQNTGWFRFTIGQYGIEYTLINDDVLRNGGLNEKYDMIIIPELGSFMTPKRIIHGLDDKHGPLPYTKTENFTSHGYVDETEDMTRGMGFGGIANLENFIINGGLLVTLGGGSIIPVELGLVPQVRKIDYRSTGVVNPGSFVKTKMLQKNNPVTYGYENISHVFVKSGLLLDVGFRDRKNIVMQYGTSNAVRDREENKKIIGKEGNICISGLIKKQAGLIQKPLILDIPRKSGRVIIFGFNPAHRHMNHHNFKFVFNAIMNWNDKTSKE